MKNEIVKTESPLAAIADLMQKSDGKFDVSQLDALLKVQMEWEKNEAKKAYMVAMAAFKADPPEIFKDKDVSFGQTSYSHATLANAAAIINKALSQHGLSAAWITDQVEKDIKVTCRVTHVLGYSEETSLVAPPDGSGKKNAIQQIASTVTYLERYTLFAITGIAPHDIDDDGAGGPNKPIEFPEPNAKETDFIRAVAGAFPPEQGQQVDPDKVGRAIFSLARKYSTDMKKVDATVKWLIEKECQVYVPDIRDEHDKALGLPGDEDSQPEEPEQQECRFVCQGCDQEFDKLKKNKCPFCFSDKITDRVIAKKVE